ncbi:MAG: hypothetical protein HRT47_01625 [Candidatus Caenarcaniphilales bacterium]|nr:hypothetical protein [Candidatus Caenarcaniphilales bacterium]
MIKNEETRVYGSSDDIVYCEGGVYGQVDCYSRDDSSGHNAVLVFSDGTIAGFSYAPESSPGAIWKATIYSQGSLFKELIICTSEDENPHSDQLIFQSGLEWAYSCDNWRKVS